MLVSKAIPNLFNGVSQQPAPLRNISQCEVMDNAYASIATGTRKRPPMIHRAQLHGDYTPDAFIHYIDRDAAHRYVVQIDNGVIRVFDLADGTEHTVSLPDGNAYLNSAVPREEFVALTVADYTFIVNKTVTVAMNPATIGGTLTGTKQEFTDLAAAAATGQIWRIEGTPSSGFDDYYVQDSAGPVWVECLKPGATTYALDAATMPWKLTRTGPTTWIFQKTAWDSRLVGDDDSNPLPSFVGRTINDMMFHRNRLGFLSDESTVFSRAGDPFNLFAETVTAVLDTDPIDYAVTHTKVSILNHAVPFNKALMLFSDRTQFQMSAPDVFTPKTPRADPVTEFESSSLCRPASAGNALFFGTDRANSTAIREYFVDRDTVSNDAADITAHVPTYLPAGAFKIATCVTEDALVVISTEQRNVAWVYKYYWGKDEKLQSAWGRFVLDETDEILRVEFIGNVAYWVIQRADGVYLEYQELEPNRTDGYLGFLVHLDRRFEATGVFDPVNNWTTWTLPYDDAGEFTVVLSDDFGVDAGAEVVSTQPYSTAVRALGDYSGGSCYIGRNYSMRYRFSTIYLRDEKGIAVTNGKLKLRRMLVNFANTGYFRAEVTATGRDTYTYELTRTIGVTSVGELDITSGTFAFPIITENIHATIDLVSDSYLPCFLQSAEWEGEFTQKAARI